MDDPSRTPLFEKAIIQRLNAASGGPESMTVLDLGTGPYALFAMVQEKYMRLRRTNKQQYWHRRPLSNLALLTS